MKLLFDPPQDGRVHIYCFDCQQETVTFSRDLYRCSSCGNKNPRAIIIDPQVHWWLDETREYWHETAGVFPVDEHGRILLFKRVKFPPGLTVPAGHRDRGEEVVEAAIRELFEETNVRTPRLVRIATDDIWGDTCRRGSEVHRWNSFAFRMQPGVKVKIDKKEGVEPVWLTPDQALASDLTFATRFVLQRHANAILAAR